MKEDIYEQLNNQLYRTDPLTLYESNSEQPAAILSPYIYLGSQVEPEELESGTLAGNIEVAGGYIQSSNFVQGSTGWKLDSDGTLYATGASITGAITATSGTIGGFTIAATTITATNLTLDSSGQRISLGSGNDIIILDADDATYRIWVGHATAASAPFTVTKAGAVTASNFTMTGGSVGASVSVNLGALNVAARGWSQTSVFSVTDADTVAWGAGTFTSADGTAYSIGANNTGNMAAKNFIYLDTGVSTTEYQKATSFTAGAGKVLIAVAQNATGEAKFMVVNDNSYNIDAAGIVANSITANELSTSITYAGSIVIDTAGLIRSGQTAYNTGTGWWIGNDAGTPKLSIGVSTGNYMTWDGTTLTIVSPNIEPTYWLGAADGEVLNGASFGPGSDPVVAAIFTDGAVEEWAGVIRVPKAADGKGISSIKIYYHDDNDGGAKDVVIKATTAHYVGSAGGAKTTDTTATERVYTTGSVDEKLGIFTLNGDVYNSMPSTMAVDDLFCINVGRVATSASDTYNKDWNLLGVLVTWA